LAKVLARFGFEWFVFTGLAPLPGQTLDDLILYGRFPPGFREAYLSEKCVDFDPTVRRALRSSSPFQWSCRDYDGDGGPRVAEVMYLYTNFHIPGGFIVPIHGVGGDEAGVAIAGEYAKLPQEAKPGLHLIALYTFERLRELVAADCAQRPKLSRREREVLAWSAQGKSAWEIGEILKLAKRTVDEHAKTAMRKLGATTRTQAVAIAIRERLFDL